MFRCDAAHDADRVDPIPPLLFRQRSEVRTENRLAIDTELLGNRGAGDHVIAGDHAHPDMRLLRVRNGCLGFGSGRIDHGHQAGHLKIMNVAQ